VASERRRFVTLVGVVFICTLAISLLDGRFLHSHMTDSGSDCGRLLGLTLATQRYKVCLCHMETQESAAFCRGCHRYEAGDTLLDSRLLHNLGTGCHALCGRLLGSM